jgi:hypothetical protein
MLMLEHCVVTGALQVKEKDVKRYRVFESKNQHDGK